MNAPTKNETWRNGTPTADALTPAPSGNSAPKRVARKSLRKIAAQVRREMAAAVKAAEEQLALAQRAPMVVLNEKGDAIGVNESAYKVVEVLAGAGGILEYVATRLRVMPDTFKKLMKADKKLELAWTSGFHEFEQRLHWRLYAHGERNFIPVMFELKALFGRRDSGDAQVNVNVDNRLQKIQLPMPASKEEFFAMMGTIADGRTDRSLPAPAYIEGVKVDVPSGEELPLLQHKPGGAVMPTGDDAVRQAGRIEQPTTRQPKTLER